MSSNHSTRNLHTDNQSNRRKGYNGGALSFSMESNNDSVNDSHNQRHSGNGDNSDKGPLEVVRMTSLLDTEEHRFARTSNSSSMNEKDGDRHQKDIDFDQQQEEEHQQYLSNLSPSSMDVTFSDPHKIDHSAFSHRQSVETANVNDKNSNRRRSKNQSNNHDRSNHEYDNDYDIDNKSSDEEQKHDEYLRSGTHFRSLLDCAFENIAIGFSKNELKENSIDERLINGNDSQDVDYNDEGDSSLNALQNGIDKHSARIRQGRPQKLGKHPLTDRLDSSRPLSRRRLRDLKEQDDEDEEKDTVGGKLTAQLAREKMTEVLTLKRALKEAEEHANAMSHANATLREASAASTARINTLTESLKITSSKVADSRADADMARAKVTSLATQLKSLKCALDETKRTCESVRSEHDDIQSSSRTLEAKLVQTESELQRVDKENFETQQERDSLRFELDEYNQTNKRIRLTLEQKEDELLKMKKKDVERNDVERARIDRTNRLENELRDARSMLVEVTSAAKDAESTNADLQNTIQHLQRENKSVHDKIEDIMDSSMREKTKLQEALAEAESGAQKLRMKATTDEEELHRIKLDQLASEKEVTQLQSRISNLEGRLKDAISSAGVVSPNNENCPKQSSRTASSSAYKTPAKRLSSSCNRLSSLSKGSSSESSGYSGENVFMIPPLRSTLSNISNTTAQPSRNHRMKKSVGGGMNGAKLSSVKCSICMKNAYGMMKSCQCGNPTCDKRAHASCVASKNPLPSVSHPGTPAPRLPCILCNER